jgi:hypothetical protein
MQIIALSLFQLIESYFEPLMIFVFKNKLLLQRKYIFRIINNLKKYTNEKLFF